MAKVRIELEKNETPDQAEECLLKAFSAQRNGDVHVGTMFHDPAMEDLVGRMERIHEENLKQLIAEIGDILDEEYRDGDLG